MNDDVVVRPATEADLGAINGINNHHVLSSHRTFDLAPRTPEWRRRWFEDHASSRHRIFVAVRAGSTIAGFASSGPCRAKEAYGTSVEASVFARRTLSAGGSERPCTRRSWTCCPRPTSTGCWRAWRS